MKLVPRVILFCVIAMLASVAFGQGMIVTGVGPINRSMGGAGTAAPLDAIGAVHWNPGSISGLETSQVSFGLEGLAADIALSTTVGGVTNQTVGDAGIATIPAVGWVHHIENTDLSIGLGVYGIAGFRNAMPANLSDPILANGPLYADAELMQLAPTLSYALTDELSIGVAPTITSARVTLDPLGPSVVTPDPTAGTGSRVHWGAGFQAGVFYTLQSDWQLGFTYKSPQWFEEFQFFAPTEVIGFDLDYPMILSAGISYRGFSRWVLSSDIRYIDYRNTDGFDVLGWRSVFAVATGAQFQLNDMIALRVGYNANQNPIQSEDVFTNITTPLIQTQNIAAGVTCALSQNVDAVAAYVYLVDSDVTGPLPAGIFGPGASMTNRIRAHSFSLGLTVGY
jgi:long-chain fatty acid transport protein